MADDQNLPNAGLFVNDNLVNVYNSRLKQLISDMGRDIVLTLQPLQVDCPNCGWDFTQGRSNNQYTSNASGDNFNKSFPTGTRCPVCQGVGKLIFQRTYDYKALVGFSPPPEEFNYTEYGITPDQVVRTKTTIETFRNMELAQYAKIQGVEYEKITQPRKTGLRDDLFVLVYWKRRHS